HRYAGRRRTGGSATEGARERAADRHVEDHEEAVVRGVVPGGRVDLVGVDGEEVVPVEVPPDLLRVRAAVQLYRVCVEAGLAAAARALAAPEAGELVARTAGRDPAVQRAELGAAAVDVLHHVDLADARPAGRSGTASRGPERPERRPVAGRGRAAD